MIKYFLVLMLGFLSCNKTEVPIDISKKTIQYKTLENIDENLLSLDIYYKDVNTKHPVVIYIHGGGWSIGDKSQKLDNKLNLFKELDCVFVSVNYRLSPFPFDTSITDRVQYPIHNIDIADAIKWVDNNIADYGGNKDKIAIMGHSAGAHLVALTGTNSQFLEEVGLSLNTINGVAVIDTQGYDVHEQVINGSNQNMYINAFGTDEILNREASPIFNVLSNKTYPKFFIAKRGTADRIAYADAFIDVLQDNGVSVTQINGSVYNHAEINNAIGDEGETLITEPLKQFFTACFQ